MVVAVIQLGFISSFLTYRREVLFGEIAERRERARAAEELRRAQFEQLRKTSINILAEAETARSEVRSLSARTDTRIRSPMRGFLI